MRITIDNTTDTQEHALTAIAMLFGTAMTRPGTAVTAHIHPAQTGPTTTDPDAAAAGLDAAKLFGGIDVGNGEAAPLSGPGSHAQTALSSGASASPAAGPSGVTLDKHGIPWDERIHANAADKMGKDGYWKKRRGLNDDAKFNQIVKELQATMAAPGPASPPATAPAPGPVSLLPAPPPGTITPAATGLPPGPAGPAAVAGPTFVEVMPKIGAAVSAGVADIAGITAVVAKHGLPNLPAVASRPDLFPDIWADIKLAFPALALF